MSLKPYYEQDGITIYHGDCREVMPCVPDASVSAIVSDPPYAEIDREYGRFTESEWHDLMRLVIAESRRILVPSGSAVFILQPNSERVGRMRPWLWEFMAWAAREWNQVQDAWWWNYATPPTVHCNRENGLMRPSMKACVWLGPSDCYRNQDAVLMRPADSTDSDSRVTRHKLGYSPSGLSMRHGRALAAYRERGGVTPFNVVVVANSDANAGGGSLGHGASTPMPLAQWWVRYLAPRDGVICDPFCGVGTMALAAYRHHCRFIGIEREERYCEIAAKRLAQGALDLFGEATA
jgi:DNA modification methylase